ncbi:hypothetical protein CCMA1212_004746 [Trichoderma ghanense]|uniref:Uncharacterized protein n=1 Tax=Trichoderma ghanense TaxID=65468 RepID=A0ABY2H5S5_9HYPO
MSKNQRWRKLTGRAVNANEVEDVGGAAERVGEEASRADSGQGAGGEEGDGEELHLEGCGG